MATADSWSDPDRCPFCGAQLASPGAGFVSHTKENRDCAAAFERWRDRIADDVTGGWSG